MAKLSRVMIVGAGEAGQMVINEINKNKGKLNRQVVALIDDNEQLLGQEVCGRRYLRLNYIIRIVLLSK